MNEMKHIISDGLRGVLGNPGSAVSLHEPQFVGNEETYVRECITTGWVSSVGKYVDRFEKMLCEYTQVSHAVATVNGTSALHIALRLVGVKAGDEVFVPTLSFVAAPNAISYCRAIPHFVDSDKTSLGVDAGKLASWLSDMASMKQGVCVNRETGRPIRALVVVHVFGHPAHLNELKEVCDRYNIALVEDAAEGVGSLYNGAHVGSVGKVSALSFNGNKIITTGGGGAILTNDPDLASKAKHLTTTAKEAHSWRYTHDEVGYNYRLPNINAALGCAQLENISGFLNRKRKLAERYQQEFKGRAGIEILREPSYAKSNYWLNVLLLKKQDKESRDEVIDHLHKEGMLVRPVWALLHTLSMYRDCPRMDVSAAQQLEKEIITLPSGVNLCPT